MNAKGSNHAYNMAALLLQRLTNKKEVDYAIKRTEDKVLVLRFGIESDMDCLKLDDIVSLRIYLKLISMKN